VRRRRRRAPCVCTRVTLTPHHTTPHHTTLRCACGSRLVVAPLAGSSLCRRCCDCTREGLARTCAHALIRSDFMNSTHRAVASHNKATCCCSKSVSSITRAYTYAHTNTHTHTRARVVCKLTRRARTHALARRYGYQRIACVYNTRASSSSSSSSSSHTHMHAHHHAPLLSQPNCARRCRAAS
jgi:hypothetical protein